MDLQKLFALDTPFLEIFVRGTCVYLALFCMLRLLKRQAGNLAVTDMLVVVIVADAAQNAMAGSYQSITDGLLLVAVIIAWDFALDWLGYRFACIGKLLHPAPLPLIKNGKLLRKNLRAELVTIEEVMSSLREQGVAQVSDVKMACLEGDGKISVVKFE